MKPLSFALIGRSGCGKGTQGELLMKHFGNLFNVSTGGLLRDLAKLDTSAGKGIKKILENGGLAPDFVIIGLWMRELCNNIKDDQGILLDGAPRRVIEAQAIDEFMDFLDRKDAFFPILIDVSREEAFSRLTNRRICKDCGKLIPWIGESKELKKCDACGGELYNRPDDNPEAINNRLDYYEDKVVPVVNYYKDKNRLVIINGEQPIEKVFEDVLKAVS